MAEPRQLRTCGERAVLVEVAGLSEVVALAAAVRAAVDAGAPGFATVTDVVPAARTVLVVAAEGSDGAAALRAALAGLAVPSGPPPPSGPAVEIPVHYAGPDLDEVGELTGLGRDGVVEAHTAGQWQVSFCGFAPGFGYLTGGDPRLVVPRRDEPRTRVPAGSVALAGEFSAVYPSTSPGGWQLIGRTDLVMFDPDREPAALLSPGCTVRFVPVVHRAG